jgi:hypothetical protein
MTMPKVYKPTRTSSLFPEENRLEKLSQQGDPLERLNKAIEWKYFREIAEKTLNTGKMTNSGPKPYDPLLMFKILGAPTLLQPERWADRIPDIGQVVFLPFPRLIAQRPCTGRKDDLGFQGPFGGQGTGQRAF